MVYLYKKFKCVSVTFSPFSFSVSHNVLSLLPHLFRKSPYLSFFSLSCLFPFFFPFLIRLSYLLSAFYGNSVAGVAAQKTNLFCLALKDDLGRRHKKLFSELQRSWEIDFFLQRDPIFFGMAPWLKFENETTRKTFRWYLNKIDTRKNLNLWDIVVQKLLCFKSLRVITNTLFLSSQRYGIPLVKWCILDT